MAASVVDTERHCSDAPSGKDSAPAVGSAVGRRPLAVSSFGSRELISGSHSTEVGGESPRCLAHRSDPAFSSRAPRGVG